MDFSTTNGPPLFQLCRTAFKHSMEITDQFGKHCIFVCTKQNCSWICCRVTVKHLIHEYVDRIRFNVCLPTKISVFWQPRGSAKTAGWNIQPTTTRSIASMAQVYVAFKQIYLLWQHSWKRGEMAQTIMYLVCRKWI